MTATAPALAPDLVAGLRRLKLSRIRAIAPEVCQAARSSAICASLSRAVRPPVRTERSPSTPAAL